MGCYWLLPELRHRVRRPLAASRVGRGGDDDGAGLRLSPGGAVPEDGLRAGVVRCAAAVAPLPSALTLTSPEGILGPSNFPRV